MSKIKKYIWNILLAFDQLLNTFGGGDPDMTLSGNMGRKIAANKCYFCKKICWLLDKLDSNHCQKTDLAEADEGKDQVI